MLGVPVQVVVRVVRVLIHGVAPGTVEAWIVFAPLNLQLLAVVTLVLGRTLAHVTTRLIGLKKNELNHQHSFITCLPEWKLISI